MHTLILTLTFALAPPEPSPSYAEAITTLDTALASVGAEGTSTTQSVAALERALELAARFPADTPSDSAALDKLARARLALAWLLLVDGNEAGAAAAMDEALRSAQGTVLPSGSFGPKVRALHDERVKVLKEQGTGWIEVDCGALACQVVIDERRSPNPSVPLYLGRYRVWIGARDGSGWEYHEVELGAVGSTQSLEFEAGLAAIEPEPEPVTLPMPTTEPSTPSRPAKPARLMPVWAEGLGIAAGVGAIVAAGILLSYHGKCESGADPEAGAVGCSDVYNNLPQSYALFGLGGASLLAFGATLTVDQVRIRNTTGRQAMLTWTLRF